MPEPIIIDTSSLIALERINLLQILCKIYKEVVIPESVIKEFGNLSLSCLSIRKVESNLLKLLITDLNLGKGEADVIALASQTGLKVIIDDLKARKAAENMGLKLTGTIGVLLKAERLGLIASAQEKVREPLASIFRTFRCRLSLNSRVSLDAPQRNEVAAFQDSKD